MRIEVLTLFPEILEGFFTTSLMARAVAKELLEYSLINIRDYALDKHKSCDDNTFGGGVGMVLKPEPLGRALESVGVKGKRVIFPTPSGRLFDQNYAQDLANADTLVMICGRYEGIDQRIIDKYVTDEISLGDYVVSSGEVASLVIIDAVYRLLDGVINRESLREESFSSYLLEYPQYTRPESWQGMKVPQVLVSGHHAKIKEWRLKKSLEKTLRYRPELIDRAVLSELELKYLNEIKQEVDNGSN